MGMLPYMADEIAEPRGAGSGPVRGRVLMLTKSLSLGGGAEVQTVNLAVGLRGRAWQVRVVSMLPPVGDIYPLREAGIPLRSLQMQGGFPDPRALLRLAQQIREFQPDVLHSHMTHANLLARVTRVLCPVPVLICTLHGLRMYGVKRDLAWIKEAAHRATDTLAEATTAVCKVAGERYVSVRAISPGKIRIIPNGVDTSQFCPDPAKRSGTRRALKIAHQFVWLAVGRLEAVKDYATMLRAFALVARDSTESVLLISGTGSRHAELSQLISELDICQRVIFLGQRSDVCDLMNAADAYLMSSIFEGLPMVLLEAAASGLPMVATNVGGNPEIVLEGATGFVAPPGNPRMLAEAMRRLMALPPDERTQMGAAAREFCISNYRLERVVDQWEDIYGEFLKARGRS